MARERRKFSDEQKAEAVKLVREVGSIGKVARDLDLTESALRNWVVQADVDAGKGADGALTTEEKAELRQLRRENRTLKMERDFLKKAALVSTGQGNSRGTPESQDLPRAAIQLLRESVELPLGVPAEGCALWEVLAEQPVRVFI